MIRPSNDIYVKCDVRSRETDIVDGLFIRLQWIDPNCFITHSGQRRDVAFIGPFIYLFKSQKLFCKFEEPERFA